MSVVLQQNDTAVEFAAGAYCSGLSAGANAPVLMRATKDATPGAGTGSVTINGSETNRRYVYIECDIPDGYDGAAGDWLIELPVNAYTGSGGGQVASGYGCRVDSGGTSQETLGSVTGLSEALDTPTPPSTHVVTVNQPNPATFAAGDKAEFVIGLTNTNIMTAQVVQFTFSGTVTAPGSIVAANGSRGTATLPLTGVISN